MKQTETHNKTQPNPSPPTTIAHTHCHSYQYPLPNPSIPNPQTQNQITNSNPLWNQTQIQTKILSFHETQRNPRNPTTKFVALLSSMKAVSVELGPTMKLRSAMELGSAVRWRTRLVGVGWAVRWRTGWDGLAVWDGNVGDDDEDQRWWRSRIDRRSRE